ncbi:uncharacterized protein GGS25DRAFT_85650 [Hypoxylon fragiforme]|uniref:uncharacterized protein n=1 Tax=Hypoxylon fragiforme TaxID=63214 RepID=UPI0020C6B928|nr:uncharacterized protein GGS25DRAFT_85650 [Hypoxylon fragiforme]KAI2603252.1 hypothetical protein GGS25DRAFT_85650 [Hypoxylon fragiforme]
MFRTRRAFRGLLTLKTSQLCFCIILGFLAIAAHCWPGSGDCGHSSHWRRLERMIGFCRRANTPEIISVQNAKPRPAPPYTNFSPVTIPHTTDTRRVREAMRSQAQPSSVQFPLETGFAVPYTFVLLCSSLFQLRAQRDGNLFTT